MKLLILNISYILEFLVIESASNEKIAYQQQVLEINSVADLSAKKLLQVRSQIYRQMTNRFSYAQKHRI